MTSSAITTGVLAEAAAAADGYSADYLVSLVETACVLVLLHYLSQHNG